MSLQVLQRSTVECLIIICNVLNEQRLIIVARPVEWTRVSGQGIISVGVMVVNVRECHLHPTLAVFYLCE